MERVEQMTAVRHFEDIDDLKRFGLDGGLQEGQEERAQVAAQNLIEIAGREDATYVEIFSSNQKRTSETAQMLGVAIGDLREDFCEVNIDPRLNDLNQGVLNLPPDYQQGESFEPLRSAWGVFWDETFNKGDLLYRFGESTSSDGTRKFEKLEGGFLQSGECYAQMAERFYDFLHSMLVQESVIPAKRLVSIVGHSITFGMMHELAVIAKDYVKTPMTPIPFGDLPKLTWEYFDRLKSTVLENNPKYGEVALFDVTHLKDEAFVEQIAIERDALRALMTQSNVQY